MMGMREAQPSTEEIPEALHQPLEWVVLKVTQRCNLNCTYCYVYNRGDDSWLSRPAFISIPVVQQLAERIREHCTTYSIKQFVVELHGGEPLLLGTETLQRVIDVLRGTCEGIELQIMLQTNGLLLDRTWLDLFERNGMSFGLSLDGPPELVTDQRVNFSGQGSAAKLLRVIDALRAEGQQFDQLLGGVLCVVDPSVDGGALVRWFADHGFPAFEFLLPDGTYQNPPAGWAGAEPYRRFLLEAFDTWYEMGARAPHIRMFEMMMLGLMGQRTSLDALGGDLRSMCVVESDGSIGMSDVLRICLGEYATDSLNIFEHRLDEHSRHYRVGYVQQPSETCLNCPHLSACGGGYLPHRFDGASFDNPSMYCAALYDVSARMQHVMRRDLPERAHRPDQTWLSGSSHRPTLQPSS